LDTEAYYINQRQKNAGLRIMHIRIELLDQGAEKLTYCIYNKKAVLSQRWPRDARYI